MVWKKEDLDLVLVPTGLLIMFCYHLFLLYRCLRHPETTVIGNENHCRKAWVERMLQVEAKDRGLSVTVISCTITAANFLASTSLALSSLIGAWIGSSSHNIFMSSITYGDTSPAIISIKYISILACFLLALASFLHCIRNFVHANFLISMPDSDIPLAHVEKAVISGGLFWTLGLRAIYFATTLLLWIFGPIPMFVCSVIMVLLLHRLDSNSTPLHQFQPAKSHNVLRKIGEENSRIERAIEQHHERLHMDGNRAQG
ncbi:PREDICTED: unnamed product [Prunus dulcis]|uniref:PREDICTED: unnamed product n=2 Tax=Prunus dulcis TaxID=3755 RepID=A0A5E4EMI5_PRUDU|nr:uncharacterized protein LOC117613576 [Prunus dulcis]XP_034212807.1 uncharacterized protein LOC117625342 [Prunus dulcis]VVA16636.1 PREDICTED: unnamed product [Prunus dulcis]